MVEQDKIRHIFSVNLKRLMKEKGVNQTQISEIACVSQQSVSNWLNEKQIPRMGVIEKLASYFGVLKSDLLEIKDNQEENPEIIVINRAMKKMSTEQKEQMMSVLKTIFKEEFGE